MPRHLAQGTPEVGSGCGPCLASQTGSLGTWPFPFAQGALLVELGTQLHLRSLVEKNSLQGFEIAFVTVVLPHSHW